MRVPKPKRKSYQPDPPAKKGTGKQDLYNGSQWRKYALSYRSQVCFCEVSKSLGRVVDISPEPPGQAKGKVKGVVDHIIAVSAGGSVWDPRNHMAMTPEYHNLKRSLEGKNRILVATLITPDGIIPMDRNEIIRVLTEKDKG